ncbi:FecR domain-containing protein [Uliginosibacterium sp. 31-16]|uniref:FecR family protein n=1 Tax=Uliginosibacterium sp. 31-16 TaxID=3068315 RepID=UPI00273D13BE|nr:FecR domain-containing protein [Uliginosibacterium sp. 31-16]MDP5240035.1 FecR domain-containing protein [Uliginosibacterium sp. 31-16]
MKTSVCTVLFALLLSTPAIADPPAETIGHIQTIEGLATIHRDGSTLPGKAGATLLRGDRIRTGKPGALGIVLTDDTTISLGSGSEMTLVDYAFEPKESKFALALQFVKGTLSYISGQIVKLAPDKVQLQTPDATIAVRGTKLLIEIKE